MPMMLDEDPNIYYDVIAEAFDGQPMERVRKDYWGGFIEDATPDEAMIVAEYLASRDQVPTIASWIFGMPMLIRSLPGELCNYQITSSGNIYSKVQLQVDPRHQINPTCVIPTVPDETGHMSTILTTIHGLTRPYYLYMLLGLTFYPKTTLGARRMFNFLDGDITLCHFQNIGYVDVH